MAVYTGTAGTLTLVGGYVTNAKSWELSIAADIHDSTAFTGAVVWRSKASGLLAATGSYTCYMDTAVAVVTAGITGAMVLTASAGRTFSFDAVVGDVSIGVDVGGGLSEVTISFESTGVVAIG